MTVISTQKRDGSQLPDVPEYEREATPPRLARWLVDIARAAGSSQVAARVGT